MTDAEKFLLSLFLKPRRPETITGQGWREVWSGMLGRDPALVLDEYRRQDLLVLAKIFGLLDVTFRVPELVELCKLYGLDHKGRKSELLARLVDGVADSQLRTHVQNVQAFECSDRGRIIGEDFKQGAEADRKRAEEESFEALRNRKLADACRVVYGFEQRQPMQRGLGIDWKQMDPTRDLEQLSSIFVNARKPVGSEASLDERSAEDARIAAAMSLLWGTPADKWLRAKTDGALPAKRRRKTAEEREAERNARMIAIAASQASTLRQYFANRDVIEGIRVYATRNSCEFCKRHAGDFTFETVPILPHPECTHEMGCRCCYAPIVKGL